MNLRADAPTSNSTESHSTNAHGRNSGPLHRRRDDEQGVDSQPADAQSGDQPLVLAQADAAATATDAAPAAAAGESASAGAGLPAVAAAGGLSAGGAALAGAGALGVAAAAGGGGGGGSTSTTTTPTSTTTSPTPTTGTTTGTTPTAGTSTTTSTTTTGSTGTTTSPSTGTITSSPPLTSSTAPVAGTPGSSPSVPSTTTPAGGPTITNFTEYEAAVAAAGSAGAVAPRQANGGTRFDIQGGFTNETLDPAPTLAELRNKSVLDYALAVDGVAAGRVGEGGLAVGLLEGGASAITVRAQLQAPNSASSMLLWMQNLTITGNQATLGAESSIDIVASSAKPNGAQVGIEHVGVALSSSTGTGPLHAAVNVLADAQATDAQLGGLVHLGDIAVAANGGDASATGVIEARTTLGASSEVIVDHDVTYSATGRLANTSAELFAHGLDGGSATISIGGDVRLSSLATDAATVQALVHGVGTTHVAGDMVLSAQGTTETIQLQLAADYFSHIDVGGIQVDTGTGPAHVLLDIWSQGDASFNDVGSVKVGDITMHVNASSDATINLQQSLDASSGAVADGFLAHGTGAGGNIDLANATFTGPGTVHLNFDGRIDGAGSALRGSVQSFDTINQNDLGLLDLHLHLADQDSTLGTAALTTINGFSAAHDAVDFNGFAHDAVSFQDAGHFTTLATLEAGLNQALDADTHYVFAVYDGTEDLNRNGAADDRGAGVLAMDEDGNGITALLVLPGVTTMTPNDLA